MKNVIYKISNKINDRIYIGSSIKFNTRYNQHKHHLIKGTHHNPPLQNHVNKYGFKSLVFEVIDKCNQQDLIKLEQYYIDKLNPYFNVRKKADSMLGTKRTDDQIKYMISQRNKKSPYKKGFKVSEETRKKIGDAHRGKTISKKHRKQISEANKGRKMSDITKAKISESSKGRSFTKAHKDNLSKAMKGNSNWKNVDYSNPVRNKKISEALKQNNPSSKKVINTKTGKVYKTAKEAAIEYGMPPSTFSKHLSGYNKKNKTPFTYVE